MNIDIISRVETTRRRGKISGFNTIGIDVHKVVFTNNKDIGTIVFQPYLARNDNALPSSHHHAEEDDEWDLEFHDFCFNLTSFGKGHVNL